MRALPHRPPLNRSALDEAKRRVPISAAWRALGLPGEPRRVCCSPFREERHPSFSIDADRLWHDFADGTGGDVVSFVKRATACDDREAIRRVLDLAGGNASPVTLAPRQSTATPARPPRDELTGLNLQPLTVGELERLADLRAWPLFAGLEIASRRGLLRCADVRHRGETHRAWIVTDDDRRAGMARRLDGEEWPFNGYTGKTNALRSDDDHPPGLADVVTHNRPGVLILEGEPDTLAGVLLAWLADVSERVGFICLPGARRPIPPTVCEKLRGRRCRIVRQSDPPGKDGKRTSHAAALAWLESLTAAGVSADVLPLDGLTTAAGQPAKDLADLCRRPADHETLAPLAAHVCAPFIQ
jgi:hypothetical protein